MAVPFNVATWFLRRTIICTAMTNTYENQIYWSTLSASKLIDKKLCHTVTKNVTPLRLFFAFFTWRKEVRTNFFLSLWSTLKALQNSSVWHFIWRATFPGNHGLRTNTSNLGSFYVTPLRDQKIFPETEEFDRNYSFL